MIEEPQEVYHVERSMRGAGHAPHVLLDEPHAAHVVARGAGGAEGHALGPGVERQDLGPAKRGLDRVHALAAAKIENPERVEGLARQIARELHDPPDLHGVRDPDLRGPRPGFQPLLGEEEERVGVQGAGGLVSHRATVAPRALIRRPSVCGLTGLPWLRESRSDGLRLVRSSEWSRPAPRRRRG